MPRLFAPTSRISTIVAGSSPAQRAGRGHKLKAIDSLRLHWPEHLMEAGGLSIYMFSVCAFATLSWHPASPIRQFIDGVILRRAVMGLGIGTALIAVVVSPWGRRSGGHLNPAVTLAFYRLANLSFGTCCFTAERNFSVHLRVWRSPHMCCEERSVMRLSTMRLQHLVFTATSSRSLPK